MNISEVCKAYDITPDTLRYYEKVGLLPKIARSKGGIRDYTQSDCNWVEFIKCMRSAGISVEKLIEYVELFNQGEETIEARKKILIEEREQIINKIKILNNTLERLNYKIEHYDELFLKCEQGLNPTKKQN